MQDPKFQLGMTNIFFVYCMFIVGMFYYQNYIEDESWFNPISVKFDNIKILRDVVV